MTTQNWTNIDVYRLFNQKKGKVVLLYANVDSRGLSSNKVELCQTGSNSYVDHPLQGIHKESE